MNRNLLQAKLLSQKLKLDDIFTDQKHLASTTVRAQNIVRFYEKAAKAQRSLMVGAEKDSDPIAQS